MEYESIQGARFIASPKQISSELQDPLSAFVHQGIPLFLPSPSKRDERREASSTTMRRPTGLFQLQRIFFITPSAPSTFATHPIIIFQTQSQNQSAAFSIQVRLKAPIVLPPDSFCVLRLPFIYGAPVEWTGAQGIEDRIDCSQSHCWTPFVQNEVSHPYTAFVQKQTILFPV